MGGVMGGLESSVTDGTTSIFFEAAYFDPDVVQGKTRVLGINSDAAYRFERGVDPHSARDGLELATRLAVDICGTAATTVGPITEAKGELPARNAVRVGPERVCALIGMSIDVAIMKSILSRLECQVEEVSGTLNVTAPSYRFDLTIEEDFAEEIARIHGYENVPAVPPRATVPITAIPEAARTRSSLRHACAALGYQEVINYSFVAEEAETQLMGNANPVRLANPIASQMSVMRTSLLGGLIQSLQYNLNRGEARAKLFEIGRCFTSAEANLAHQPERLAGLAYGARYPEQWAESKVERFDFFAVKGDVEQLLEVTGATFAATAHPALHPGRSAEIMVGDVKVGWIGELHPRWQQHFELPAAPVAFELDLALIQELPKVRYQGISRMQAVRRDVAILVDEGVQIQAIQDAFQALNLPNIVDFALFDVYRGQSLDSGKKSLAFRIVMQDTERTLTDIECDEVVAKFVEVMSHKFGATLRK
jgi:phenylalanyl-tRNA synthetase beta chain